MTNLIKYVFQKKQKICIYRITRKNESIILTKDISCKCKCKFDGRKCNLNQKWNNDKCQCECRKPHICEKYYISNPATCSCENGKYLATFIGDSVVMCDEMLEETKTVPRNFKNKKFLSFTCICIR